MKFFGLLPGSLEGFSKHSERVLGASWKQLKGFDQIICKSSGELCFWSILETFLKQPWCYTRLLQKVGKIIQTSKKESENLEVFSEHLASILEAFFKDSGSILKAFKKHLERILKAYWKDSQRILEWCTKRPGIMKELHQTASWNEVFEAFERILKDSRNILKRFSKHPKTKHILEVFSKHLGMILIASW